MCQVIDCECLLEKMSSSIPKTKNKKNFNPKGRSTMFTTRNKRTRLSSHRSSPYPLPKGLLIGFWG